MKNSLLNFENIFSNSSVNAPNESQFHRAQMKVHKQVYEKIPVLFRQRNEAQDKMSRDEQKKSEIESLVPEIDSNTEEFTADYKVQRKQRRTVVAVAALFEGLSSGLTLHLMLGIQIAIAVPVSLVVAILIFTGAAADKVASQHADSRFRWTWLVFTSFGFIVTITGVVLGLINEAEFVFLIIHMVLSILALTFLLISLKYAEALSRDNSIGTTKKTYDKIRKRIRSSRTKINNIVSQLRSEIERFAENATIIQIHIARNPESANNVILPTRAIAIINYYYGEDIVPLPVGSRQLTHLSGEEGETWRQILAGNGVILSEPVQAISNPDDQPQEHTSEPRPNPDEQSSDLNQNENTDPSAPEWPEGETELF